MKLLLSILLSLLITGCVTSNSNSYTPPEITRIYDADGHFVGKIRHYKYESRVYDKDGKLLYKLK